MLGTAASCQFQNNLAEITAALTTAFYVQKFRCHVSWQCDKTFKLSGSYLHNPFQYLLWLPSSVSFKSQNRCRHLLGKLRLVKK